MPEGAKEFIFVDESGDPGHPDIAGSSQRFFMAALQMDEAALLQVRAHLINTRYHHSLGAKELKGWWAVKKDLIKPPLMSLAKLLVKLTEAGYVKGTAVWLNKRTYLADGGLYLARGQAPAESHKFRNYVLKRLLRRHRARFVWGDNVDLVLDRYQMEERQIAHIRSLLDSVLSPRLAHITAVDSVYVGLVQVADVYTKLAKQATGPTASVEFVRLCDILMSPREISWGR